MKRVNDILYNELFRSTLQKIDHLEEGRLFCRHNMDHVLSVARIMLLCAKEENLTLDQEVVYATALLHDLGRIYQYQNGEDHALAGLSLAQNILVQCGFTRQEQTQILMAIGNHNQKETSDELSYLLKKADKLSRNCFLCPVYQECYWPEQEKNRGITI